MIKSAHTPGPLPALPSVTRAGVRRWWIVSRQASWTLCPHRRAESLVRALTLCMPACEIVVLMQVRIGSLGAVHFSLSHAAHPSARHLSGFRPVFSAYGNLPTAVDQAAVCRGSLRVLIRLSTCSVAAGWGYNVQMRSLAFRQDPGAYLAPSALSMPALQSRSQSTSARRCSILLAPLLHRTALLLV